MKNIKVAMVGAVAAALLFGTGCKSDQPSQEIRNQDDLGMQRDVQGTGGSGMDSSGSSLQRDSLNTVPDQNSTHQGDSMIHSQPSSTGMGGSGDLNPGQQGDLNTGHTNDLGTGGAGSNTHTYSGSGGSGTSTGSGMNSTTESSSPSSMRGSSSKSGAVNTYPGTLNNEAGSRTNSTGSNISTDTNPTEPRNNADSQVPRR